MEARGMNVHPDADELANYQAAQRFDPHPPHRTSRWTVAPLAVLLAIVAGAAFWTVFFEVVRVIRDHI
jgi:hypothetical protein